MKANLPITDEQHAAADANYKRVANSQKRFCASIADKIEAGEPLNAFEREWTAAALRHVGSSLNPERPRPRGQPAKMPDFELVMAFVEMTRQRGMSKNAAYEALAERYGTEVNAVKKRLGQGQAPEAKARRAEINVCLRALGQKPI